MSETIFAEGDDFCEGDKQGVGGSSGAAQFVGGVKFWFVVGVLFNCADCDGSVSCNALHASCRSCICFMYSYFSGCVIWVVDSCVAR